jgi:hypothetical protein
LHKSLFIRGSVFNGIEGFLFVLVLFEEMREILIKADFEEGLLEERPFNGLVKLEVDVFPDDISQAWRAVVRVDVL